MDIEAPPVAALALSLKWAGIWLCLASAVTYALFRIDGRRAMRGVGRLPEANLLWLSTFGGWPGALLALRRSRGLRFSGTFRGWLRGIVAAELLFLGMAALPQGSLVVVAEGILSVALGEVRATERDARPGQVVLDSTRRKTAIGNGKVSNIVTLSSRP